MTSLLALTPIELRLLARDWTVLVFAFTFPPLVMLILAGVFGTHATVGFFWQNPQHYYVAASAGVPVIALALVGLPVTLASYRERGVLRRFEAFGVTPAKVVATQAVVTTGLVAIGVVAVLAIAVPTYGIPHIAHPAQVIVGAVGGAVTLVLLGVAIGFAVPSARAAQAVGLLAFFPLYLLGGGGPPRGAMTGAMRTISDALPSPIPAIADPWLGIAGLASQLMVFAIWSAAAIAAIYWLTNRRSA
ncbi:MAG: ABC transporter permease [Solirubrobacteraceae bacterium]